MPRAQEPALVCPQCGDRHPGGREHRFCPRCRLPLVIDAGEPPPVSARHARARKVNPQLSEGELVKVAYARNQAEAEFIQGLLLEEGVPSLLRRTAGFDVPDFLAAGPRDVMVPMSASPTAREVLLQADVAPSDPTAAPVVSPRRLLAGILLALAVGALVICLLWLAVH